MLHPVVAGVYCLFKDRQLVYVGKSRSVYARIDEHRTKGRVFDYATVMPCPEHDMAWVETALIKAFQPEQNRSGKVASVKTVLVQQIAAPDLSHVIYTPPQAVRVAQEYGIGSPAVFAALKSGALPYHYKAGRAGPKAPRHITRNDLIKWCEATRAVLLPSAPLASTA